MVTLDLQRRFSWIGNGGAALAVAWHTVTPFVTAGTAGSLRKGWGVFGHIAKAGGPARRALQLFLQDVLPLRIQGRELLLIIDPTAYWYASLPQRVLGALDFRGRYTTSAIVPYILGAVFGILLISGFVMAMLIAADSTTPGGVRLVIALFFGLPVGGLLGFIVGGKCRPSAMWVMRRVDGVLVAVVPKAMLKEYAEQAKRVQVYRASSLSNVVEQNDSRRFYKGKKSAWQQKIEFGSMVVILISLVGLMMFFALAVKD